MCLLAKVTFDLIEELTSGFPSERPVLGKGRSVESQFPPPDPRAAVPAGAPKTGERNESHFGNPFGTLEEGFPRVPLSVELIFY